MNNIKKNYKSTVIKKKKKKSIVTALCRTKPDLKVRWSSVELVRVRSTSGPVHLETKVSQDLKSL